MPSQKPRTVKEEKVEVEALKPVISKTELICDIGGDTIKIGYAGALEPSHVVPNTIQKQSQLAKRTIIGLDTLKIADINGLSIKRPIDHGYCVNAQMQRDILAHTFKAMGVDCRECSIVLTEPVVNFGTAREEIDKMLFEDFGFLSVCFVSSAMCAMKAHLWECREEDDDEDDNAAATADDDANMDVDRVEDDDDKNNNTDHDSNSNTKKRVVLTKKQMVKMARVALSGCVLDIGFSFAHATPIFDGKIIEHYAKRLNLGGRALTNYLKELVSYRQWNVMDEFALIEDVKLKTVYCVEDGDIYGALNEAKKKIKENKIAVKYVLPDGVNTLRGFIANSVIADSDAKDGGSDSDVSDINEDDDLQTRRRKLKKLKEKNEKGAGSMELAPDAQSLVLVNERFMVPEILFHPRDIGLNQCGISELVAQALHHEEANENVQDRAIEALTWLNVVICGGCAKIPGLCERVKREIRSFAPNEFEVDVRCLNDPITGVWLGLSLLASTNDKHERLPRALADRSTSRDDYFNGSAKSLRLEAYNKFVGYDAPGRLKNMRTDQ
jgi:actin-related protein 6